MFLSSLSSEVKCEIELAVPEFRLGFGDLFYYHTGERHIIFGCDSDLRFVPETHYFHLLPMKRQNVLLSDAWSEVEKNPEGAAPKRSQLTINCNTTCSISMIAPQETTCAPVAQVTADISKEDVSVNLDSAAIISDHETTGLLECSAVCCSNEMEVYQPKQKAIFQQISKNGRYFTCSWYEKYSWITLCLTKKVFCLYC